LLQRAKKQPEQVKLVLDTFKKEGIKSTYNKVMNKLESYKTLGYSASGIVVETKCSEFSIGDHVSCGGAGYAVHAEMIAIPKNLAVKLPEGVSFEDSAYTTVGSIALQGIRQADLRLGETVAVIGIGLIGLLTIQMLKASGCNVTGIDVDDTNFKLAKEFGCSQVFIADKDQVKSMVAASGGAGFDAVLITASTSSNEPLELALDITRKKGKVVFVGDVGMKVPRPPFYLKEIDLRISSSYGPGRYDPIYEEMGVDYPQAYVRWTENRNMQAFLNLIAEGKIDVKRITTHTFDINEAKKAYNLITSGNHSYIGILLKYSQDVRQLSRIIPVRKEITRIDKPGIAFVGAGSFAQSNLLPHLKNLKVELTSVSTTTPVNAKSVAKIFGFKQASTDSLEIIKSSDTTSVFIASRHDSHAEYVLESLKAGKPVFVEKPLCINRLQLDEIDKEIIKDQGRLLVGFNRRFSKPFIEIKEFFKNRTEPFSMVYRVNAGFIPKTHWVQFPSQGGRIVGECCHFIDCMTFLTGSLPVRVFAEKVSSGNRDSIDDDNVSIIIRFGDGSTGTLLYFANGDPSYPKEYFEAFNEGNIAVMDNFTTVTTCRKGKKTTHTHDGTKGHRQEVESYIKSINSGIEMPITYKEIHAVTSATFCVLDSLASGLPVDVI
jgi:polar amino acid transport system substrate-binding protein